MAVPPTTNTIMKHPLERSAFRSLSGQKFHLDGTEYTLRGKLGDGAVGVVRRAISAKGREVAVKFLAPDSKYIELTAFDDVAARFRHEGLRGIKLDHPRLVKIVGYADNTNGENFDGVGPVNPFLVMERVHGRTLEHEIKATPDEQQGLFQVNKDRLSIAIQIASAVAYIHKHKLVHRDIKPANIFIAKERSQRGLPIVKVGDFGVVKWGDFHQSIATGTLTMTFQQGLGTLKYMSPEQAIKPKDVTAKSDVFSIGITIYEIFTGEILASPHHVFQVMNARLSRGTTHARFLELGHNISSGEHLCGKLLDCFLRGVDGRPKIDDLLGAMAALYSQSFDTEWYHEI